MTIKEICIYMKLLENDVTNPAYLYLQVFQFK